MVMTNIVDREIYELCLPRIIVDIRLAVAQKCPIMFQDLITVLVIDISIDISVLILSTLLSYK